MFQMITAAGPETGNRMCRKEKFWHALVFLALVVPYFTNLGISSLWDSNEPLYAETAREMFENGDFVAPRFNDQPRTQKPPLTYWMIALSFGVFGFTEFAVRLPGACAAAGLLSFTYFSARLLFSARAALIALLATGTTLRIFVLARRLPIDMLLLFFLAATAYFIIRGLVRDSRWDWALAYISSGLGFLTKGPIAVLIPFGACLTWMLASRTFRIRRLRPFLGALLLPAVVLPWYIAIYQRAGWEYIAPFFLRDNLERFASRPMGPSRGPLYYAGTYLADYFPWSILSLAALLCVWLERRLQPAIRTVAWGFPIIWSVLVFAIFTLSKNKQEYYIAPMYPMMSIVLGGMVDRMSEAASGADARVWRRIWQPALAVSAIGLLVVSVLAPLVLARILPAASFWLESGPSFIMMAGAAVLAWSIRRGNLPFSLGWLGLACWTLCLSAAAIYLPEIEHLRPVKSICRELKPLLVPEDEVGYYRASLPSMVFYLRRPIFEEFDANQMTLRFQSAKRTFCILNEEDLDYFAGERNLALHILDRRPRLVTRLRNVPDEAGRLRQELLLVSNRPVSHAADTAKPDAP